jgi:hypothetical protein
MNFQRETSDTNPDTQKEAKMALFLSPTFDQKPLEILYGTEGFLRRRIVKVIHPFLSTKVADDFQDTSWLAEESLQELATIDVEEIGDRELQPSRILIGLTFVGISALLVSFLLLYLSTTHSELSLRQQISSHWYQYIFSVCLGVTGMLLLGREAMRRNFSVNSEQ